MRLWNMAFTLIECIYDCSIMDNRSMKKMIQRYRWNRVAIDQQVRTWNQPQPSNPRFPHNFNIKDATGITDDDAEIIK